MLPSHRTLLHVYFSHPSHSRWKSARHYEVRYNHKRLGYFSHIRQMKIVFYPWKTRHLLMHAVKVKQRLNLCKFMRWVEYFLFRRPLYVCMSACVYVCLSV